MRREEKRRRYRICEYRTWQEMMMALEEKSEEEKSMKVAKEMKRRREEGRMNERVHRLIE